ncbi:hypothetical protein TNCV_60151 [Trichonephila clavipes]|nr:hypothetical protein TNCV_60151 [Trichonephila clavipes]
MYSAFVEWSTLNSRRATSPLERFIEEEERWEAPESSQGAFSQNWEGTEPIIVLSPKCGWNAKSTGELELLNIPYDIHSFLSDFEQSKGD